MLGQRRWSQVVKLVRDGPLRHPRPKRILIALLIILTVCSCASLLACSYLYATTTMRAQTIRSLLRANRRTQHTNAALLDRLLQRHGSAPISKPDERPGPAQSFIPTSPWEAEWEAQEQEDAERGMAFALGVDVADLTDAQKEELRRRVSGVTNL